MATDKKTKSIPADSGVAKFWGVAAELANARQRAGLSQNELHRLTGISRTVIAKYEVGENKPGARELKLLCDALKVTPNRVIYGKETPFESSPLHDALVLDSDEQMIIRGVLFMSMLTREDRAAVLTLIYSLLRGQRGKRAFDTMMKVVNVTSEALAEKISPAGKALAIPVSLQKKLTEGLEQKIKSVIPADELKKLRSKKSKK